MPAERDSYAYFTINTLLTLKEIEAHMGEPGDGRCWSIGDQRTPPQRGSYRFSQWALLSGIKRSLPLDDHLQALWRRMSNYRIKIVELPEGMNGSVSCVGHFKSRRDNVEIASGHFATAAYYRLNLDCDFYFDDNFGNKDEGKPYWSW